MQARRNPLLLDLVSGLVVFRGLGPSVLVDIQYDEPAKATDAADWRNASTLGGGSRDSTRDAGMDAYDPRSTEISTSMPHASNPAACGAGSESGARGGARLDQTDSQLKQPQIEVDWDPDEAPTRVCVGGSKLSMWKPSPAEPFERLPGEAPTARFAPTLPPPSLRSDSSPGSHPAFPSSSRPVPRRNLPPLPSVLERAGSQPPIDTLAGYPPEERRYFPGQTIQDSEGARPVRRRWLVPTVGGMLIAATSGGSAYWLFSRPVTRELVVETIPADARVLVDGKQLPGSLSPYHQRDLPVGQHQLLVEKPGFTQHMQTIALDEHQDKRSLSVTLAPELKVATLSVSSSPPGAEILVDGRPVGLTTPAAVSELNLGQHSIALRLEGYAEGEQSVRVPEDALVSITLVKTGDGRAAAGRALSPEAAAKQHRAEIRAARVLARYRERMGLPPDPATQALLESDPDAVEPTNGAPTGNDGSGSGNASPAAETGTLQLNSHPWSEVYVDGEHVGRTPLRALALPVGRHTVRLENPELSVNKAFEIMINAGRTLTQVEELAK